MSTKKKVVILIIVIIALILGTLSFSESDRDYKKVSLETDSSKGVIGDTEVSPMDSPSLDSFSPYFYLKDNADRIEHDNNTPANEKTYIYDTDYEPYDYSFTDSSNEKIDYLEYYNNSGENTDYQNQLFNTDEEELIDRISSINLEEYDYDEYYSDDFHAENYEEAINDCGVVSIIMKTLDVSKEKAEDIIIMQPHLLDACTK